jgi:hypothetical protein
MIKITSASANPLADTWHNRAAARLKTRMYKYMKVKL